MGDFIIGRVQPDQYHFCTYVPYGGTDGAKPVASVCDDCVLAAVSKAQNYLGRDLGAPMRAGVVLLFFPVSLTLFHSLSPGV